MNKITVEQIMNYRPCNEYPIERVKDLIGEGKTPLEVCDLEIPTEDVLWLLLREDIIPETKLHELGCLFAEDALKLEREAGREPHADSWEAVKVKRRWMKGELLEARLAASAARSAAWAASWSKERSAESTSWAAARLAAWAAWSASELVIIKKQLKQVRAVLEGGF